MKIYVMTHKRFDPPQEEIYVPMHVGRALSENFGYLGDNTGENISDLNPFFGELTGLFWIWNNDNDSDYIGVAHYRRFYLNNNNEIMTKTDFEEVLREYDCITSDLLSEKNGTNKENYLKMHDKSNLDAIEEAIENLYPEYKQAYDDYMKDNTSCYSNLLVMPHEMYNSYCAWLFGILFDASERIDVSNYDLYHKRVYGFLSEMLLEVYIRHNRLNAYRCNVGTFGDKAETNELVSAVGYLISKKSYREARKLCQDIIDLRPDIMLPMSDSKRRVPILDHITCILDLENEMGYAGMAECSSDIEALIEHYKKAHDVLSGSEKSYSYLKSSHFTPIAAVVMTGNDISKGIRKAPIDISYAQSVLKKVFSEDEYNTYIKLKEKFAE